MPSGRPTERARVRLVARRSRFIGISARLDAHPFLAPSTSHDASPRGRRMARASPSSIAGVGGTPETLLELHPLPGRSGPPTWRAVKDTACGRARRRSTARSPNRRRREPPVGGWQSARVPRRPRRMAAPLLIAVQGGSPLCSRPANHDGITRLSADGRSIVYSANAGTSGRHRSAAPFRVAVDRAEPAAITPGEGLERSPVVTGDGRTMAFISATRGAAGADGRRRQRRNATRGRS